MVWVKVRTLGCRFARYPRNTGQTQIGWFYSIMYKHEQVSRHTKSPILLTFVEWQEVSYTWKMDQL